MGSGPVVKPSRLPYVAGGLVIILVIAIAYGILHGPAALSTGTSTGGLQGSGVAAPEFTGIVDWENSPPLTLPGLRGKVVLVDFWTYSCINCQNTFPYLRRWYNAYRGSGLVIVGVHSPEFDFEKSVPNIRQAIQHYDVTWPVAVDSNMATWNAYNNQYWPAEYLIDKNGRIRETHFGEGNYDKTEQSIRSLLAEAGHNVGAAGADAGPASQTARTAELYAAAGRGFDVPTELPGTAFNYVAPAPDPQGHLRANSIYWNGLWNIGQEFAEHARDSSSGQDWAEVDYSATTVVMVAANGGQPVKAFVTLDGKDVSRADAGGDLQYDASGHSYVEVGRSDLFTLIKHSSFQEHTIKVSPLTAGLRVFTFDFNG
ncbi:MAG TPA: thioredoxin family protein [Candidatus Solibacter sp.]|jgi:thiol-disulfide isomerase/thioredoxin|nr:thioredoxin family protein [Candidatus Solibacter sp.]